MIVGGGFGGLFTAQALAPRGVEVTLVDRRNIHLFQPLLYQVATGVLSPGDIASSLRGVLRRHLNVTVFQADASGIDARGKRLLLTDGELPYDTLVVAAGTTHHYFGNEAWAAAAPGLKTIEDALKLRQRIFSAFEAAERNPQRVEPEGLLNFAVIGGGPTGVELAGAMAELARGTLKHDFRRIRSSDAVILLLEGGPRILPGFPEGLSARAAHRLSQMGVRVRTGTLVTGIDAPRLTLRAEGREETLTARTVLWAAGVKASPMGEAVARATGAELDSVGRVIVEPDLTVPGHPDVIVIGDLARCGGAEGEPLPGLAPVAMQQGSHAARTILRRLKGRPAKPFRYRNKGALAVIGRNAAVADLGWVRLSGLVAWLIWIFVHIRYLVEFDNQVLVLIQWGWNYVTRKRGARLITG
ncbi:MAG: NAD(P)/FAD-dependent oxidoreductase [SAR324 cluster bacterium]|nr:NAD(P)/FAD-dependent oxidoreductase [SAR324 cluster bacterium]